MNQKELNSLIKKSESTKKIIIINEDLNNLNFTKIDSIILDVRITDCVINNCNFSGIYINTFRNKCRDCNFTNTHFLFSGDVSPSNFINCNFEGANLCATFHNSTMRDCNLVNAGYNPFKLLGELYWPNLIGEKLTLEMMRQDALITGQRKMTAWSKQGPCPFRDTHYKRAFQFQQVQTWWKPGPPTMNMMQLWKALNKKVNNKIS